MKYVGFFFLVNQIGKYIIINKQKKNQIKLSEDCTVMFPPKKCTSFCFRQSLNFFKKSFNTDPIKLKEYYLGTLFNCNYIKFLPVWHLDT